MHFLLFQGLDRTIEDKRFYNIFSECGQILSCHILIDETTRLSKGVGFVHYDDEDAVERAIMHFNGITLGDSEVEIGPTLSKDKLQSLNLYVQNLDKDIGDAELCDLFTS